MSMRSIHPKWGLMRSMYEYGTERGVKPKCEDCAIQLYHPIRVPLLSVKHLMRLLLRAAPFGFFTFFARNPRGCRKNIIMPTHGALGV